MRLALYQPDIPQNTGTIMRLAACLGLAVDIIRPAGFDISDKALRRSMLDYGTHLEIIRHDGWDSFVTSLAERHGGRLIALTTKAPMSYIDFAYHAEDVLLLGRETSGLPDAVHAAADARVTIPLKPEMRSLNVAVAAAMVAGEALRQIGGFAATPGGATQP